MALIIVLAVGIFSGCSSKKADNVVPKVEGNPIKVEEVETKVEETVKVEKIGIIGAWQREFQGFPEILIFREDGTATIVYEGGQDMTSSNTRDLLYDVKVVEKNIYSVNLYNVMIDAADAKDNKLTNGFNVDTMTINIIDENNFQGAYKSFAEISDYKKINLTMAESMMGKSIFSDKGYKSIEITADYLKLQDSGLKLFEYAGIQGDAYKQYFVFNTTFGGDQIFSFYVNSADLRLFTEDEYFNLNP